VDAIAPDLVSVTKRWSLDRVDFAVDTALGMTIRGRFDRVGGTYSIGTEGTRVELAVDATSVETDGIWDGLVRSAAGRALTEHPQVRFTSTQVRELGNGRLRLEGQLEAGGTVQPAAFDAVVKEDGRGLRLEAAATLDRQRLGKSADRLAVLLPATARVEMRLGPS
jgi:polyisoprenoid-binding protein YceI